MTGFQPCWFSLAAALVPFTLLLASRPTPAQTDAQTGAQIVPDRTLPVPSRTERSDTTTTISGGTPAGGNLFHSFEQFSIAGDRTAVFESDRPFDRIITRVTGNFPSQIDGTLRSLGNADLILLNPNGIQFGDRARLDLGGSFFASTAERLVFADGGAFDAVAPNADALLSVSVPLGVQFGTRPAPIAVRSRDPGLQVNAGQTLTLVGGDLQLDGGQLRAPEGRIALVGTGNRARVDVNPDFSLDVGLEFAPESALPSPLGGDVRFQNGALVLTSGAGGGAIEVVGDRVQVVGGSQLLAETLGANDGIGITIAANRFELRDTSTVVSSTFDAGRGGDLAIAAREAIALEGVTTSETANAVILQSLQSGEFGLVPLSQRAEGGIFVGSSGSGASGNLSLTTDRFTSRLGAQIVADVLSDGDGGELAIRAQTLDFDGSFLRYLISGSGEGDRTTLTADRITVRNGGFIASIVLGAGRGGDLVVEARDRVEILDIPAESFIPSFLSTTTFGSGTGGDLIVRTRQLLLRNGGQVSAQSGGEVGGTVLSRGGPSGNVIVRAEEAIVVSGATPLQRPAPENVPRDSGATASIPSLISSATYSNAPGGQIRLETGRLQLQNGGQLNSSTFGAGDGGEIVAIAREAIELRGASRDSPAADTSMLAAALNPNSGDAGSIRLITPQLALSGGARIALSSLGRANAGSLDVQSDRLTLRDGGVIEAATASGQGGNLNLQASRTATLFGGSRISSDAGGTGDGGDIRLDVGTLTLFDGSAIDASALLGRGGNIGIRARGLFLTPDSQVTASSQLGVDGAVQILEPQFPASVGLNSLTAEAIDPTTQVTPVCAADEGNTFVISGRNGIAPDPTTVLRGQRVWTDVTLVELPDAPAPDASARATANPPASRPLQEATGWVERDGTVELMSGAAWGAPPLDCAEAVLGDGVAGDVTQEASEP